jgi:hypothetical protein
MNMKEVAKFIFVLFIGLLLSFILSKFFNYHFKWWITIGAFSGVYLGSKIFSKKNKK